MAEVTLLEEISVKRPGEVIQDGLVVFPSFDEANHQFEHCLTKVTRQRLLPTLLDDVLEFA